LRIGIDLMGGDNPPTVLFEAVKQAVAFSSQTDFTLFATQQAIDDISAQWSDWIQTLGPRLDFIVATDVIEMHEEPLLAIRKKKHSSLSLGIKLLKKRFLNGFISLGNTGALIAGATLSLPLLPGIKRPALLAILPTEKGSVAIIDVGGNVSCKSDHLVQFAKLGAAYQRCGLGIKRPKVGLLNIGAESKKGTSEIRQAYTLLQSISSDCGMQFVGNVEGRDIFQGSVDVLVTDGFTGNVLLKASEGISSFILQQFSQSLKQISVVDTTKVLADLNRQFDYEEYNGAILCGVDAVIVKCHGQSSAKGLLEGIRGTVKLVENKFVEQLQACLLSTLNCI